MKYPESGFGTIGAMSGFNEKRFVVTGGSSGIGLAIAGSLADGGASVCIVGRNQTALDEAVASIGPEAWGVQCDVGDVDDVGRLSEAVRERWDGLDGLVNNAGVATVGDLMHTEPDDWDECFRINARGPFLVTRALVDLVQAGSGGSIVNISSTLAEKAIPGMVAYNAAKAALNQMTRSLALELAPTVRVNGIMPAVVDTPIHANRGMSPDDVKGMGQIHPMQRVGRPEDIAAMTLFLLSESASWMTGAVIPVDGGMMAG